MIAHSQPIALPSGSAASTSTNAHGGDYAMHDAGSYTGSSEGTFNPASYTRHFLGSPISWRAGSWGMSQAMSRIPAGSPTAQLLSSIDLNDYRNGKAPSSLGNDSIMNAFNVFEREGELCRNYTCCGQHISDLHALLEHFEEVHIVVLDPSSAQPQAHIQIPFNPIGHDIEPSHFQQHQFTQNQQYQAQQSHQQHYPSPFDPDDMELDIDLDNHPQPMQAPPPSSRGTSARSSPSSCATTPPDTPILNTPLSQYPSPHPFVSHLPVFNQFGQPTAHMAGTFTQSQTQSPYASQPPSPPLSAYESSVASTAASTRQNSPVPPAQGRPSLNLNLSGAGFPNSGFAAHGATHMPTALMHGLHGGLGGMNLNPLGLGGLQQGAHQNRFAAHPADAFNAYARFAADYSAGMPGAQFNGAGRDAADVVRSEPGGSANSSGGESSGAWPAQDAGYEVREGDGTGCVPPALLFAASPKSEASAAAVASGSGKEGKEAKDNSKSAKAARRAERERERAERERENREKEAKAGGAIAKSHTLPAPLQSAGVSTHTAQPSAHGKAHSPAHGQQSHSQHPQQPPALSLLTSKPFRCPKPACNKSYKQANGLKYHMTHGSCNFAPPKDLEHVKDLLERKRREREREGATQAQGANAGAQGPAGLTRSASLGSSQAQTLLGAGSGTGASPHPHPHPLSQASSPISPAGPSVSSGLGIALGQQGHAHSQPPTPLSPTSILSLTYSDLALISEADLRDVEREAERRLRPFACGVGECTRRYKNMNGLRYHYQHSGDHGAIGLALLASGQHECLGSGAKRASSSSAATYTAHHAVGGHLVGGTMKSSASTPVSRVQSRVGTPAPLSAQGQGHGALGLNFNSQHHHQQPSGIAMSLGLKTTAITPTPVQAQAFIVPNANASGSGLSNALGGFATQGTQNHAQSRAHTPVHSRGSSGGSPRAQVYPSPTQQTQGVYTSPTQQQQQAYTTSPTQQQAQQAQLAAAYQLHYAQQAEMQRQYQAQVQAVHQAQAQAQAQVQQQQAQAQAQAQQQQASQSQYGMGMDTELDGAGASPSSSSGELGGGATLNSMNSMASIGEDSNSSTDPNANASGNNVGGSLSALGLDFAGGGGLFLDASGEFVSEQQQHSGAGGDGSQHGSPSYQHQHAHQQHEYAAGQYDNGGQQFGHGELHTDAEAAAQAAKAYARQQHAAAVAGEGQREDM